MAATLITMPEHYDTTTTEEEEEEEETTAQSGSEEEATDTASYEYDSTSTENVDPTPKRRYYPHDVVVQKEKVYPFEWTPNFGVVVEPNHPNLTSSEFDDKPKVDTLNWNIEDGLGDAVYVQWGNSPTIKHVKDEEVALIDRIIAKGQKVSKEDGTVGYVTDTQVRAAIQILGTTHVITDVDTKKLKPLTPFVRGVEVLYDNKWVGIITHVRRNNHFRLESIIRGQEFMLETIESDGFMRQDPFSTAAVNYPGQRTLLSGKQLSRAQWKSRTTAALWRMPLQYLFPTPQATYMSIVPIGITIKILQEKPSGSSLDVRSSSSSSITLATTNMTKYIDESEFHRLEFLGIPSYETVQLGSRRLYRLDEEVRTKPVTSFNVWMSGIRAKFMNEREHHSHGLHYPPESIYSALATKMGKEVPVRVVFKQTYATVEWNDGVTETIPAADIPMICSLKDSPVHRTGSIVAHSFATNTEEKYGIVQRSEEHIEAKTGTILVNWLQINGQFVSDLGIQEESIYDLRPHPQYTFYRLHTLLFLKEPNPNGWKNGVVTGIDIQNCTMLLGSHSSTEQMSVYPHQVIPLTSRCTWNFFTRKWEIDVMLPHEHHFVIERQVPVRNQEPITLPNLNNNNSRPKFQSCLVETPKLATLESAPPTHYYYTDQPQGVQLNYASTIQRDLEQMKGAAAPNGVWVRAYEDRVDLLSVLFLGPMDTPYEDGLFLFDLQLPANFPGVPPKIHFVTYSDTLNPLIASDGTFCVSKLKWDWSTSEPPASYILNVLRQLQTLLFTPEPFFTSDVNNINGDADFSRQFVRVFNEKVYVNVLTSAINQLKFPHDPWREIIGAHYSVALVPRLILAHKWLKDSGEEDESASEGPFDTVTVGPEDTPPAPAYPLLPLSKGFKLALATRLETLDKMIPSSSPSGSELKLTATATSLKDGEFKQIKAEPTTLPSESTLASDNEREPVESAKSEKAQSIAATN